MAKTKGGRDDPIRSWRFYRRGKIAEKRVIAGVTDGIRTRDLLGHSQAL
jgi:hypothetical protein